MSGAISFFLGLFGLGAAGAVNAGQNISQSKKQAELDQIYTARAADRSDAELRQMHERVRKEWWSISDCHPNCLGKWPSAYSDRMGPYYQTKFWFRDHLNAKGIPYDDAILDEVPSLFRHGSTLIIVFSGLSGLSASLIIKPSANDFPD